MGRYVVELTTKVSKFVAIEADGIDDARARAEMLVGCDEFLDDIAGQTDLTSDEYEVGHVCEQTDDDVRFVDTSRYLTVTRAYATHRPLGIGCYPFPNEATKVVNYDTLTWVPEVRHRCFGYVEYASEIPGGVLEGYDLVTAPDMTLRDYVRLMADALGNGDHDEYVRLHRELHHMGYTSGEIRRAEDVEEQG